MPPDFTIPINTFAQYLEADEKRKIELIQLQLKNEQRQRKKKKGETDPVYGNTARAQIRRTIVSGIDHSLTESTLSEVRKKVFLEEDKWHKTDQKVNIHLLECFKGMRMPDLLAGRYLERLNPQIKTMPFYGINIKIVPSLTFRLDIKGDQHIGAYMLHASKKYPFSLTESKIVSALLYSFLNNCVVGESEIVNPDLCFCLDPYAGTTVVSNKYFPSDMKIVEKICAGIPRNFEIAAQRIVA
jgi:hypothetical protein